MNARRMGSMWMVCALLAAPAGLYAQTPMGTAFTYQGRLVDGGNPANGDYDFKFSLYDALTRGSQVGSTLLISGVSVSNGLFAVQLDFGDYFRGDALWLAIEVAPYKSGTYTLLSPRQELTPAPYASFASVAGSLLGGGTCLWEESGSNIYYDTGYVGIGTSGPLTQLDVVSSSITAIQGRCTGEGTLGALGHEFAGVYGSGIMAAYFDGGGYFAGNVGIGTSSPGQRLSVNGLVESQTGGFKFPDGTIQTTAGGGASLWQQSGSNIYYNNGSVGIGTSVLSAKLQVHHTGTGYTLYISDEASDTSPFVIDQDGNIGAGKGIPDAKLHVVQSAAAAAFRVDDSGADTTPFIIDQDGNVGVGTTTPAVKLDVNGTARITGFRLTTTPTSGYVLTSDTSGNGTWQPATGGLTLPADETVTSTSPALKVTNSGTGAGSHAISACINTPGSGDQAAGYFSADGSSGHAIYARNNSGASTISVSHGASSGDALWATSNGSGGYFRSSMTDGHGIKAEATSTSGNDTTGGWFESASSTGQAIYAEATGNYANAANMVTSGAEATTLYASATGASATAALLSAEGSQPTLVVKNSGGGDLIQAKSGPSGNTLVFSVENDGRAVMPVLQITGGSDLAENFDVGNEAEPGMVVMIDADRPGKLCVAKGAYNRCVAGVISGANGVEAGMLLSNLPGEKASRPVALSGRVWVHCDASNGTIVPGDLLTTSDVPGHAMKVTDHARATGAILGKAMTRLDEGRGLVLVLVNLQ